MSWSEMCYLLYIDQEAGKHTEVKQKETEIWRIALATDVKQGKERYILTFL